MAVDFEGRCHGAVIKRLGELFAYYPPGESEPAPLPDGAKVFFRQAHELIATGHDGAEYSTIKPTVKGLYRDLPEGEPAEGGIFELKGKRWAVADVQPQNGGAYLCPVHEAANG